MSDKEQLLIILLERIPDKNGKAIMLQSYIAEEGLLSDEAAAKVKELLK